MNVERVVLVVFSIVVPPCEVEDLVGYEVFTGAIALHDGGHHVLRHVLIIRQKLLRIFGQTVTAIAKGGVIIVHSNTWVKPNSLDNCLRIQSLHLCIRIQFVEVADTKCQVGVRKELYGLGFGRTHEKYGNAFD